MKRNVHHGALLLIAIVLIAAVAWAGWWGANYLEAKLQRQEAASDRSLTLAGRQQATVNLLAFGDSGDASDTQRRLASLMEKEYIDAALHTGDIAYESGTSEEFQKNFLSIYSASFRAKLLPSPGNHDYATDNAGPYRDVFSLPTTQLSNKDAELYYSQDIRGVHLVSLDSNRPLKESSDERTDDMLDWLKRDLLENQSKPTIVFFHHAPFNIGHHKPNTRVQQKLVPLFDQYGVDIVVTGHEHSYQRSCRLLHSQSGMACNDQGLPYIVTGGGGKDQLYPLGDEHPGHLAFAKSAHHYVRLLVSKQRITVEAVDINGEQLDQASYTLR